MTEVLKWVTAGLAIWGAVSILAAVFWALIGRRIFRKPPVPTPVKAGDPSMVFVKSECVDTVNDVINELRRRDRINGGA